MPRNKRHHYVPKFLLKKFSKDQSSIQMYLMSTGGFVGRASIAHQCQREKFYGDTDDIEKQFGNLETEAAVLLREIDQSKISCFSQEDIDRIRTFVHFQNARTARAADEISEMTDGMMKSILKNHPGLNSELEDALDKVVIEKIGAQFDSLRTAIFALPLLTDLSCKFLINAKEFDFVISDHPVVLCNQWAENHSKFHYFPNRGLASKGLMILMPISPKLCVMFYDSQTYAVGKESSKSVCIGLHDIKTLNRLQIRHARSSLYCFDNSSSGLNLSSEISALREDSSSRGLAGPVKEMRTGKKSQLILSSTKNIQISSKFSFVRVIDNRTFEQYNQIVLPVRSKELVSLAERMREEAMRSR